MKILHLGDLHIGKIVQGFSLLEDQRHALEQITRIIKEEAVEVVIIAGDIYDRKIPPKEAVQLYNEFIAEAILRMNTKVIAISGNHDSRERIEAGNELNEAVGYYIEGVFKKEIKRVTLEDSEGEVDFYLIPFGEVSEMRLALEDDSVDSFETAFQGIRKSLHLREGVRSVAVAHCYAVGSMETVETEKIDSQKPLSIDGKEYMLADTFQDFTYAALGHLHRAQWVSRETIAYCGTFMQYSFSEEGQKKSVTLLDLKGNGSVESRRIPILAERKFRTIRGLFSEIIGNAIEDDRPEDYIQFVLEDGQMVENGMQRLRQYYPNAMMLTYPRRQQSGENQIHRQQENKKTVADMFEDFYFFKTEDKLSPEEEPIIKEIIKKIGGNEHEAD